MTDELIREELKARKLEEAAKDARIETIGRAIIIPLLVIITLLMAY